MMPPNRNKNCQWSWRESAVIGVFLLAALSVAIFSQRMFSDGGYLTVMLNNVIPNPHTLFRAGSFRDRFQQLINTTQILKQVQSLPRTRFGDDHKGNQSLNTVVDQESIHRFDNEHEPIMVLIDNSPQARASHSGLSSAVIVYETLVEGGATRLAAVFAGPPPLGRLGPIRSVRPVFVDIASGFGALLWHAGGSPEALALIRNSAITDLNEISYLGPRYFWRDYQKPRPHNLFTDSERMKLALVDFALKISPPFQGGEGRRPAEVPMDIGTSAGVVWQWAKAPLTASSSPATAVSIDFSLGILFDVGYNYDTTAGIYARLMAGRPHVDRHTSAQITADNVIIQRVPAEGYYASGYGRLIINVIGEGEALFLRDGLAFSGRWRKTSRDSQTEWLSDNGAPFFLKPGNVWVEIVPGRRRVSYE